MRLTLAVVAALGVFASGSSFGANTPELPESTATRGKPLSSGHRSAAPLMVSTDMIRSGLRAKQVDPDSLQGKRLTAFLSGFLNDPQAMKGFEHWGEMSYSPETRMRILRLLAAGGDAHTGPCSDLTRARSDFFEMARTLSPEDFDRRITLLELITRQEPKVVDEHYSLATLLEANAWLYTQPVEKATSPNVDPAQQERICRDTRTAVATMDKMPEPLRRRRSYEFFRVLQGKTSAAASVVAAPRAYFEETFDEKVLPATLRRRLPRDGSHPLPFKHIVFEGRWVSELPGESGPVRDVYINRRNNGVVAEMTEATGTDSDNARVDFTLNYGFESLRRQLVTNSGAYRLSQRRALAYAPAGPDDILPVVGKTYQFATTEPALSDEYLPIAQCEIGESRPASEISPALTGLAIGVQCTSPRPGKGQPYMTRSVWLKDYGFALGLEWIVGGKSGSFQIDNVVVE